MLGTLKAFFSFIKVKCEFWTRHASNIGDFVKVFGSLNPLKIFAERSILDTQKKSESVSIDKKSIADTTNLKSGTIKINRE